VRPLAGAEAAPFRARAANISAMFRRRYGYALASFASRSMALFELQLSAAVVRAHRSHLGIGLDWLRFTYVTPVPITKLRIETVRQVAQYGCAQWVVLLVATVLSAPWSNCVVPERCQRLCPGAPQGATDR
jgi:hypothetical protein